MRILVQKFGGTSLSVKEARELAIKHIQRALKDHYQLVIVVSAMGRKGDPYATDTLLDWVRSNGGELPAREQDLLLSCGELISATTLCSLLNERNIPSTVLTGGQAGIITDYQYGNANIISVQPDRINELLNEGRVVIVTGFQGRTGKDEVTTLGRGGSDTTATALGAALKADYVDIYTDVNGVLTADPRIVNDAQPLKAVTYTEICHMAYSGAKVIHPRAVEIAMQANIPIRIRSTFSEDEGTLVTALGALDQSKQVRDQHVTGVAHVRRIAQIEVTAEGQYDLQLKVFKAMAQHKISVDFINVNPAGVVYTVFEHELDNALTILRSLGYDPKYRTNCSKVSVVGGGMNGVPGIMAHIVEALTEKDIQILQSADSYTTIWVLVRDEDADEALRALHRRFNLHRKADTQLA